MEEEENFAYEFNFMLNNGFRGWKVSIEGMKVSAVEVSLSQPDGKDWASTSINRETLLFLST